VITTSSGCLLKRVLSEKPSNESVEDYLDELASRLVGLMRPLPTQMNLPSPGRSIHVNNVSSKSAIGERSLPPPITSQTGSGSQSPSVMIPGSSSDMLMLLTGNSSAHSKLDQTAEAPTSPGSFLSLFHKMHHASRQQTAPLTTPHPTPHWYHPSPSQNTSPSIQSHAQSPSPPPRPSIG